MLSAAPLSCLVIPGEGETKPFHPLDIPKACHDLLYSNCKPKGKEPSGDKPGQINRKVREMGIFAATDGKTPNKANLRREKRR